MPTVSQIAALISSAARGNSNHMRDVAEQIVASYGDGTPAARQLRNAMRNIPQQMMELPRDVSNCVYPTQPECRLCDLWFPAAIQQQLCNVIRERQHAERLLEQGLRPANRVLLSGPSGTGKTSIAHALANATALPLYVVSLGGMVGSHMGETGNSISKTFNALRLTDCVLLIDECDALLARRTASSEGSATVEINRSTATLLTEFDRLRPGVIVICATNLLDCVDSAFMRRFDLRLEVPYPTEAELLKFSECHAARWSVPLTDLDLGVSYATAKLAIEQRARAMILSGEVA